MPKQPPPPLQIIFFHHGKIGASPRTKRRRGIMGMDGMLNLGLHE
jgi:hypothetical protein